MADKYVRSTTGADANNASTWALAKATIFQMSAADSAGDRIFISSNHNETGQGYTFAWAGLVGSPTSIISCDDTGDPMPPTARKKGATMTINTALLNWTGSVYNYGITFNVAASSSFTPIWCGTAGTTQVFEECDFVFAPGLGPSSSFTFGVSSGSVGSRVELINCNFSFSSTQQFIGVNRWVHIKGGGILAGSAGPTGAGKGVFGVSSYVRPTNLMVEGFDFSALPTNFNLVNLMDGPGSRVVFRNIKVPLGWAGNLVANSLQNGSRVEAWNIDDSATNYRVWIEDYSGTIKHSASVYRDGFTGGTKHSLRMATNNYAKWPCDELPGVDFPLDLDAGTNTVYVDILNDGATLTNADIRLDVMGMGDASSPLGVWAGPVVVDTLAPAVNHPASSESWTTDGLAAPVRQRMSVTITTAQPGNVIGRVALSKPNTTVYIDPELRKL